MLIRHIDGRLVVNAGPRLRRKVEMTLVERKLIKRPSGTLSIAACIESWPKLSSNPISAHIGPIGLFDCQFASSRATFTGAILTVPVTTLVSKKKVADDVGYRVSSDLEFFDGGSRSGRAIWIASL